MRTPKTGESLFHSLPHRERATDPSPAHNGQVKRERTEAIVLHTFPARERDKLVVFLTSESGKRRGWAYGARSLKSRFGASLEPLSKIRLNFVEKENEEVVRIESAELVRSLFSVHQDLGTSIAASYIAETVDTFAQSDDPSELMYRLLDRVSEALLHTPRAVAIVTYVEIWTLKIGGIFPSTRRCIECHETLERPLRYDTIRGGFVCTNCDDRSIGALPNEVTDGLELLIRLPVEEFVMASVPDPVLYELRSLARALRRGFLGHELKSHDILATVLSG